MSAGTSPSSQSDSEEEEYIVEAIRGWRYNASTRCKEYLIKWKNYTDEDNTWEPEDHLHCPNILKEFKSSLPTEERRCFNHKDPDGLTGFQRHATFDKCIGADGPHESDEDEASDKPDKQKFYALIQFKDSEYAEEVTMKEFLKHQPEEAWKFIEQRLVYKT